MSDFMQILSIGFALAGATMVFVTSRRVFEEQSPFGNPTLLALCIAVMAFVSLLYIGAALLILFGILIVLAILLFVGFNSRVRRIISGIFEMRTSGASSSPGTVPNYSVGGSQPPIISSPLTKSKPASSPATSLREPVLPLDPFPEGRGPMDPPKKAPQNNKPNKRK